MIIIFFFYEDTSTLEALSLVTSFILWFKLTEFSPFLSSFENNFPSFYMYLLLILSIGIGKIKQRKRQEKRQLIKRSRDFVLL